MPIEMPVEMPYKPSPAIISNSVGTSSIQQVRRMTMGYKARRTRGKRKAGRKASGDALRSVGAL